jgi:hypothetical protein
MGWKVQVVDGGLSDMYNTSTLLADNQVRPLIPDGYSGQFWKAYA